MSLDFALFAVHYDVAMDLQQGTRDKEAAISYCIRERCFLHLVAPFHLHHHVQSLQKTAISAASDRLISEPGLTVAVFPSASIVIPFDVLDGHTAADTYFQQNIDVAPPPQPYWPCYRDIKLPLQDLILSSDSALDLDQYREEVETKRSSSLTRHWAPLSTTRNENNEGLFFPPNTSRLHSLLLREINNEIISTPSSAEALSRASQEP